MATDTQTDLTSALLENFLSHLENQTSKYYFDDSQNPNLTIQLYARYSDDLLTTIDAYYVPSTDWNQVTSQLPSYYLWLREGSTVRLQHIDSPALLASFDDDKLHDCYATITAYLKDTSNHSFVFSETLPYLAKIVPQQPIRSYDFLPVLVIETEEKFNKALVLSEILFYSLIDKANTIHHRFIVEEGTLNSYSFSDFDYIDFSFNLNLDVTWDSDAAQPSIQWYMKWMVPPSDSELPTAYYIEIPIGQDEFTPGYEYQYTIPFHFYHI